MTAYNVARDYLIELGARTVEITCTYDQRSATAFALAMVDARCQARGVRRRAEQPTEQEGILARELARLAYTLPRDGAWKVTDKVKTLLKSGL